MRLPDGRNVAARSTERYGGPGQATSGTLRMQTNDEANANVITEADLTRGQNVFM